MNGNNYPNDNYQPQDQGQVQNQNQNPIQQAPGGYAAPGNIPNYYNNASAGPASTPSYSAPTTPSYSAPAYDTKPAAPAANQKNIFTYIILALLVLNLLVGVINLLSGNSRDINTIKADSETITKYERNLGKKNVKLSDDKVETEYSTKYVTGYAENIGSKELTSVTITVKFYKDGICVGSGSDYLSYLAPGAKMQFSAGAYDIENFDSYEIMPVEASDY